MQRSWCCLAVWVSVIFVSPVSGQDLIQLYQSAHLKAQADQFFGGKGLYAAPLPPVTLPSLADSVQWFLRRFDPVEPEPVPVQVVSPFEGATWRVVRRLERGWFENQFKDVKWAYLGNSQRASLDTTWTSHLRANLEAHFGPPTRTLAEVNPTFETKMQEYIQFEYWFVLNDTIPAMVMDVNGPFDRGVVLAVDQRFRMSLHEVRSALMKELALVKRPSPYVDYYYDPEHSAWYRTGYDGENFFTERIRRPDLVRGRPVFVGQ